jgi:pantoate--beta-alanine ligase
MVALSECKDSNKISTDFPNNYIWDLTFFDKRVSITVIEHINEAHKWAEEAHSEGLTIGFVPTMGALHAGHRSLIELALEQCDRVIASIYVNPTQFNNPDDLKKYPRTPEADLLLLERSGCHAVFCPSTEELYTSGELPSQWDYGTLSHSLEGYFRPGHFNGVLTIVKKLFLAVTPDKAFFGEKDFQQLALIRRMTIDEQLPIEIIAAPTIRESDGLAMSSRNMRLNPEERTIALNISRILLAAHRNGRSKTPSELLQNATEALSEVKNLRTEYCALVLASNLQPVKVWPKEPCVLLVAAFVGDIRLIDNVIIS